MSVHKCVMKDKNKIREIKPQHEVQYLHAITCSYCLKVELMYQYK